METEGQMDSEGSLFGRLGYLGVGFRVQKQVILVLLS